MDQNKGVYVETVTIYFSNDNTNLTYSINMRFLLAY